MVEFINEEKQLNIVIPISGIEELYTYQRGILRMLEKIELENCEDSFKEDLKTVYKLLSHMLIDKSFLSEYGELSGNLKNIVLQSNS